MITCAQLADRVAATIAADATLQGLAVYRDRYRGTDAPGYPVCVVLAEGGAGLARWATDAITYNIGLVVASDPSDGGNDNTYAPVYDATKGYYAPPAPAPGYRSAEDWLHLILAALRKAGVGGILEDAEYTLSQADSYPLDIADCSLTYTLSTSAFPASIAPLPVSTNS